MDYGFNIDLNRSMYRIDDAAVKKFRKNLDSIAIDLRDYLLSDNITIDAKTVAKHLFPLDRCDVFISHSYADQDLAIQLALDLKKKGIHAFIDSTAWGSAYDLLKAIDEKHCEIKGTSRYHYDKRNRSTAHVYMILATALQQMIAKSSALFFLNTDRSLSTKHSIAGEDKTHSPWIHMELMFSYLIWQAKQDSKQLVVANESYTLDSVPVVHEAYTEHLKDIKHSRLQQWINGCKDNGSSEDTYASLYRLHLSPNQVL
ncbi:toll/interleukin-1 receptor domain-containing protein [Pseudomonas fluorescens]|uniref:toll/interleukin-1 receptor domain-containing protein n=1 Tax=Pseudomonas fluorescens TaxID=294 RepID=UPI00069BFC73|nr:toll/interleukin-1 receptor domain-containing protein [Pseudomonas fluorescens]